MKPFLRLFSAALVATVLAGPALAADYVLKASHSAAAGEPYDIGLKAFAEKVKERSGGRVEIEIYPNNQLGSEKAVVEGILVGTVDIGVVANGVVGNFVPEVQIFDLPFLFRDRAHMYAVMDGPVGAELKAAMEKKGLYPLAFYEAGIRHILTKKPVNSIEDLKGQKIRTMQVPSHIAAFKAFGANPAPMPYNELYGAIQSGVVDGAEAANSNYYAQKFYEVAPNYAQVAWTALVAEMLMSEEKLKAMPEDLQKILVETAAESAPVERKAYADADARLLAELEKQGVKVTHPDVAPFRKASETVYVEFVKTPEQKAQLEAILATK